MIRKATVEDIPAIREIAEVAFRETYKDILSTGQMEYMMEWMYSENSLLVQMTEKGHTFFIEEGVGYVSVRHDRISEEGKDIWHLEKLYVLPALHGHGSGRRLFEKAVDYVRSATNGPAIIELNVNRYNKAVTFYRHLGMKIDRDGDFPIGNGFYMNDHIMSLDIYPLPKQ